MANLTAIDCMGHILAGTRAEPLCFVLQMTPCCKYNNESTFLVGVALHACFEIRWCPQLFLFELTRICKLSSTCRHAMNKKYEMCIIQHTCFHVKTHSFEIAALEAQINEQVRKKCCTWCAPS